MVCYNLDRFTGGLTLAGIGGLSGPRASLVHSTGAKIMRPANPEPATTQNPTLVSHPVTQPRHSLWNPDDELSRRSLLRWRGSAAWA